MTLTPQEMLKRAQDIDACNAEAMALTQNPRATRRDLTRANVLLSRISALRAGFTTEQVRLHELNTIEARQGDRLTVLPERTLTRERETELRAWMEFHSTGRLETRVGQVGDIAAQLVGLSTPGAFVPIQFLAGVHAAMKMYDPIFDPGFANYVETSKGGILQTPYSSDLGNDAAYSAESSDTSDADLSQTGHAQTVPKSFRTPYWKISIEAQQDVQAWDNDLRAAEYYFAKRIARFVGKELIKGDGATGHIFGVIPSLIGAGVSPTIASGSSSNTGGSETGANSIGTADLAKLYTSVDQAYRQSPKACWLMNDNTLSYLLALQNKFGQPIFDMNNGIPTIYRKPVYVSPSLDNIGPSAQPVLFGDWSYYLVHHAKSENYVMRYNDAPELAEKGIIGYRMFDRYDGALLWNNISNQNAPIAILQNHS